MSALLPGVVEDLTALVAIPSVSSLPDRHADVERAVDAVSALLADLACPDIQVVREGGQPAIIARFPAPEGQPTVCLYAHLDVQPTGDLTLWSSAPFEATQRGARLYGRGVVDDKAGIAVHLAALRAFGGKPPVGVTLFIEGEEEIGSPTLADILARHSEALASDVFVICDSGNWLVGTPAFTTALRGLVDLVVQVDTLDHALHSGQFGGVAPDALTTLIRLLATLHDDSGRCGGRRPGAGRAVRPRLPGGTDRGGGRAAARRPAHRDGTDRRPGVGPPAITVLALDATSVADASNTLSPTARAKVSMRIAPNQDPAAALEALRTHLIEHAPFGANVTVTDGSTGSGTSVAMAGPVADLARDVYSSAFRNPVVEMGQGGSIPMVADFQRAYPQAQILVTGVSDPDSRMHGIDESLDLIDLEAASLAEAALLQGLADQTSGRSA
jgi:acetylornithine deacetylase/succinyl-diaminopimelate desuccinylase-like protein